MTDSGPTPVVTCFLRHDGEILLVRRAEDASTYPGLWAGISGYVQSADPYRDAVREIAEETGLTASRPYRVGAALHVTDSESGHDWLVHPFLFDVSSRSITLNHEAADHAWVPASHILRELVVPGLWDAYRRVSPTTEDIALDRSHGAGRLAEEALQVLRDAAAEADLAGDRRAWIVLESLVGRLSGARPAIASIGNRVRAAMERAARIDASAAAVLQEAHAGIRLGREAERLAAEQAEGQIAGKRMLTLSFSSTVDAAVRGASPGPRDIIVCASEPGGEGHSTAIGWHEHGIDVVRIPDAAVSARLLAGDVEVVLVGADSILPDGSLVNKVGTLAAALAAREAGIPFVVTASMDKLRSDQRIDLESIPPAAIFPGDRSNVPSSAHRFDRTPADLITVYCTERGLLTPDRISSLSAP